ncbi:ROK family protein [Lapidilactobacillus mulanensis]|uniref:ROK family protein n=1 Tax=Lapidilactobacillus mulanensis TaxID=2485999 RepID=A0ABW4DP71_9LACO|nr:ROK family protein [Lapidilactobacillus mulanensis]
MKYYVGFDIGGTTIKHGVVDESGQIIVKSSIETPQERDLFITTLADLVKTYQLKYAIEAVGVCTPGIVQKDGYLLTAGAIKCMYGVNLKTELEKQINLSVTVENDANAAAIAEHWLGAAVGIDNYLCLVIGTGFGGGIVINGQIYRGAHGMAGEFGWSITQDIDLTKDLEEKSLNVTSAVVGGLCYQYSQSKIQVDPTFKPIKDARIIFEAAHNGETLAKIVLNKFYYSLATGILNLTANFDPEVILIGGGISANQEFNENLQAAVKDLETRHRSIHAVMDQAIAPVKSTKLLNDSGLIGAVYQIFHNKN